MNIEQRQLKNIIGCALLAAGEPVSLERLMQLFTEEELPEKTAIREALAALAEECLQRGLLLKEVASGFCLQIQPELQPWISRLWEKRPPRYSRALLETLALIAYRQPITRAEIEEVRGVNVASTTFKTLMEREWIRVVGHRDVPGKPALYATTKQFLTYFNLKTLAELPPLAELTSLLTTANEIVEPAQTLLLPAAESEMLQDENVEAVRGTTASEDLVTVEIETTKTVAAASQDQQNTAEETSA